MILQCTLYRNTFFRGICHLSHIRDKKGETASHWEPHLRCFNFVPAGTSHITTRGRRGATGGKFEKDDGLRAGVPQAEVFWDNLITDPIVQLGRT